MDYSSSSLNYDLNKTKLTLRNPNTTELSQIKNPPSGSTLLNNPLSTHLSTSNSSSSISLQVKDSDTPNKISPFQENFSKDSLTHPSQNFSFFSFDRIGKLIILKQKNNEMVYVMGPLFPFFLLIDLAVNFVFYFYIYKAIPTIFRMIGILISGLQIFLFIISGIKNPGLPKKEYENLVFEEENKNAKNYRQCKDCKLWIDTDEKTIHCKKCKVCIEGYDHHCEILDTCVGKNNLKVFYFSVLVSFLTIFYSICAILGFK